MSVGIMTHMDMDGVGCAIMISAVSGFKIEDIKSTTYGRIRETLDKFSSNIDFLFITDLSLKEEELRYACEKFKYVWMIDHHETSLPLVNGLEGISTKRLKVDVDTSVCGTMNCYNKVFEKFNMGAYNNDLLRLAKTIDTYDLWKFKEEDFDNAKRLNFLFESIGWNEFFFRFQTGFNGMTETETKKVDELVAEHKKMLEECTPIKVSDNLMFVIAPSKKIVNEVSITYDVENYIIYYTNYGKQKLSCRSNNKKVNFPEALTKLNSPFFTDFGGHKRAAGVDIIESFDIENDKDALRFWRTLTELSTYIEQQLN